MMTTALDTDLFAAPNIVGEARPGGSLLLRSAEPLASHPATLLDRFREWCSLDPDYGRARRRDQNGAWRTLTYGEADRQYRAVGRALLDLGLGPNRPIMIMSENSLEHLTRRFLRAPRRAGGAALLTCREDSFAHHGAPEAPHC